MGEVVAVGTGLGPALAVFHFLVEGKIEPEVASLLEQGSEHDLERVSRLLGMVPHIGLLVITAVSLPHDDRLQGHLAGVHHRRQTGAHRRQVQMAPHLDALRLPGDSGEPRRRGTEAFARGITA